jgi:hypothetical protein
MGLVLVYCELTLKYSPPDPCGGKGNRANSKNNPPDGERVFAYDTIGSALQYGGYGMLCNSCYKLQCVEMNGRKHKHLYAVPKHCAAGASLKNSDMFRQADMGYEGCKWEVYLRK